ncbi:MAG: FadR family transcriptional regulator [Spirochaetales bacterium]|nr:FadR family transcriptional regulator [Spirochaetales bacterium]
MRFRLKPVAVPTPKEIFVKQIEELILSGEIGPGEKIPPERILADKIGVSRPVVHEGLLDLAGKGLVTMKPRHGCYINDYRKSGSFELLNALYHYNSGELTEEIRDGLEELRTLIGTDAIRKITLLQERKKITDKLLSITKEGEILKPGQSAAKAENDYRFHYTILYHSGNIIYPLILNSAKGVYLNLLEHFFRTPDIEKSVNKIKKKLIDSVIAGNSDTAAGLMKKLSSYSTYFQEL